MSVDHVLTDQQQAHIREMLAMHEREVALQMQLAMRDERDRLVAKLIERAMTATPAALLDALKALD